ncbi:MAG: aminotransferase, partial [Eudoraea sp.]
AVMANTNILAIEAAKEALRDDEFYKYSIMQNFKAKSLIYQHLDDLGLQYIKSHTNFVFFETGRPIKGVIDDMKKHNVLIGRPFPPLNQWARISTGRLADMDVFGKALKQVMG